MRTHRPFGPVRPTWTILKKQKQFISNKWLLKISTNRLRNAYGFAASCSTINCNVIIYNRSKKMFLQEKSCNATPASSCFFYLIRTKVVSFVFFCVFTSMKTWAIANILLKIGLLWNKTQTSRIQQTATIPTWVLHSMLCIGVPTHPRSPASPLMHIRMRIDVPPAHVTVHLL